MLEKLKDKKIIDCTPDDIKEFADAVYCDDACASRLFQKCLESNVYKDTQNTLKGSYKLTKDFISQLNEYMPEELINSEMLYTPLKDLKVKDVMPNETIEALHNMEKSMRVMLDMPDADISEVINNVKEMPFLEYYKQGQDSARRIFNDELDDEDTISSKGYVISTFESVIYSLKNSDNFRDAVLKAVNLGRDTDTVGAICGGLAGIFYGFDSIPVDWIEEIPKISEVFELCEKYEVYCDGCL